MAVSQFFFHDAAASLPGTLPSAALGGAPAVTATGAATNRQMDGKKGTAQVTASLTTLAQLAAQQNWFRRWCSPLLAAQTIARAAWNVEVGCQQSSASSALTIEVFLYVWRPSTGAQVVSANSGSFGIAVTTQTFVTGGFTPGADWTLLDGDILVVEAWGNNTQTVAAAFTNSVMYDGTATGSTTSEASFITAPQALNLLAPQAQSQEQEEHSDPYALQVMDGPAVRRGAYFCLGEKRARRGRPWVPSPDRALAVV